MVLLWQLGRLAVQARDSYPGLCWLGWPLPPGPALPGSEFCRLLAKGRQHRPRGPIRQAVSLVPPNSIPVERLCSLPLRFLWLGKDTEGLAAQSSLNGRKGWCNQNTSSPRRPIWRQSLMGKDKGHKRAGMAVRAARAPGGHVVRVAHGSKGKAGPERKGDLLEIPQPVSWQS